MNSRFLKNKKGAEETSSFMIWLIIGVVLLVLVILWQVGFFGKLGTWFGLTAGLDMEGLAQSCAKYSEMSNAAIFAFCTFKEVTLADGRVANVNCNYPPIAGELNSDIKCPDTYSALEFCKGQSDSLSPAKFKKVLVAKDNSIEIAKCSDLLIEATACGNGKIDIAFGEECEGTNFGAKTCADYNTQGLIISEGSKLTCDANCKISTVDCGFMS